MPSISEQLTGLAYGLGWKVVCRAPEPWARSAFMAAADVAWRRQGPGVEVLEANLDRVIGPDATGKELRALSRAGMRSYARYWLEVFRLPVISRERILADMHCTGDEGIFTNLAAGRGVVLALPHMGNWEHAGAWVVAKGAPGFTTVAERLRPESVYEKFVAFRESLGMEVLPATGGGVSRFGVLSERLRSGRLVCLLADRDITGGGIEVDFFGEKARMMGGPAALAASTGAALLPVTLWFTEDGWGARVHEEIPVPAGVARQQQVAQLTQRLAEVFEEGIRAHPQDWHMLQRVFVADLDPDRLAASVAAAQAGEAGRDSLDEAEAAAADAADAEGSP